MSSFVVATPDAFAAASENLTGIGSAITQAHAAAAASTSQVLPAAEDEVSAAIARLFGGFGQEFQALSGQSALFHDQFVHALSSGGFAYAAGEAANSSPLQSLEKLVFSPVEDLTGRPLFGNGANGAAGTE